MAMIDLYSKRRSRELHGVPDVYTYDSFSANFRVKLSMLIDDLLGDGGAYVSSRGASEAYDTIVALLKKEYGVRSLADRRHSNAYSELHYFIENEPTVDRCLDAVELSYRMGDLVARKPQYYPEFKTDAHNYVDSCIIELNARFKESGYGYELIDMAIMRVDSEFMHTEAVKPAIQLLNFDGFEAARIEFFGAYEHYRHKRYKEALVDAAKCFESTCKVILTANGWAYTPRDGASKLIEILVREEFLPALHKSQLTSLQSLLSSGIPTLRNNLGGHGDGPTVVEVSQETVAYGLHLTASAIVFLGSIHQQRTT
ncbi:STM4504/CBY_0614 family protein [Pseudomonas sp. PSPC3-3]|uniref:STM4504/CBY_0614 family protein n=1 Tax=unclassified Pseudomonas TaxID=196821 RepID=UPI003CED028F